ncbi:Hypothetical protein PHPALM_5564, partial [Phytophthora palmivora]
MAMELFPTPPKKLLSWTGQALMQWDMIMETEHLLLVASGGKDSLSLLHVLLRFQKRAPVRFELACATVDPQTPSFDPSPLKEYMRTTATDNAVHSDHNLAECPDFVDSKKGKKRVARSCKVCAVYKVTPRKFTKWELAQHLDDLAESFFMSAMHNGQLRTMKAKYWNDQRDVE